MDVDVHDGGVEINVENAGRTFVGRNVGDKGLLQCGLRRQGADIALVDKHALAVAVTADVIRAAHEAVDMDTLEAAVHGDHARGVITAVDRPDGVFERAVAGGFDLRAAIADKADGDLGVGERHALHH